MPRRRFNKREKTAMYILSDGKCSICGKPLPEHWHGDHVIPYALSGATAIENAQAVCPECNLRKGAKMQNKYSPRDFQKDFIDAAVRKAEGDAKYLVANVHPGSGKTLAVLMAADILKQLGQIDAIAVFVPRVNLAVQFEHDWKMARDRLEWSPTLRSINHRNNTPPFLRGDADGYVTTYDSLIAQPDLHRYEISRQRTIVVFDEAQQLGIDYDGKTTRSAELAEYIAEKAAMVWVLSGTPYRADNSPLLFAHYTEPDKNGFRRLIPDVEATYLDGVKRGYLRKFEAVLHDGVSIWQRLGWPEPETIRLSEIESGLYRVLKEPDYWQPLVDRFVETLKEDREYIDKRLCGLVAAYDQSHAIEVCNYIKKKHTNFRVLLAVSQDGKEAHKALREFRQDRADILVTVQMAYVGYDYKPISVILPLTGYRTEGYLRQLIARGLRVMPGIDTDIQVCKLVAPDDIPMNSFVEKLRRESNAGIREVDDDNRKTANLPPPPPPPVLGWSIEAFLDRIRARGIDPTGDLSPEQWQDAERIRRELRLPLPATQLVAFARQWNHAAEQITMPTPAPVRGVYITEQERETALRSQLSKLASQCDYELANNEHGTTNMRLKRLFNRGTAGCTVSELEERIRLVLKWKGQGYYD